MGKLYMMYPNKYIEDYVFIWATDPNDAVSQYCSETAKEPMSLDKFWEDHSYDEITSIRGKVVKDIIFED